MPRMRPEAVREVLVGLRRGRIGVDAAMRKLRALPFVDARGALLDTHRALRCGVPEVVFCQGKTPALVARIALSSVRAGHDLLATRADERVFRAVRRVDRRARFDPAARIVTLRVGPEPDPVPGVAVVTAGSSDRPVAEEARAVARFLGNGVDLIQDVGVAGIHRLLARVERLQAARVVIVIAGMEGALASVVGGLVAAPVIAVPTSVGYGANFKGMTTLLAMMNACASNVLVVNIDNGFGAAYAASLINRIAPPGAKNGNGGRRGG